MTSTITRSIISIFLVLAFGMGFASTFKNNTPYSVCFTPQSNCTQLLVNRINHARKSIYVQAYSFTSYPIAKALLKAHRRGVKVEAIFDKSNFNSGFFSFAHYLIRHKVPSYKDSMLGIAHNKVMVIDRTWVETGSFNFTKAAQKKNAENMLIIKSIPLARSYYNNWMYRMKHSSKIKED